MSSSSSLDICLNNINFETNCCHTFCHTKCMEEMVNYIFLDLNIKFYIYKALVNQKLIYLFKNKISAGLLGEVIQNDTIFFPHKIAVFKILLRDASNSVSTKFV